jgi:hypothetical protein
MLTVADVLSDLWAEEIAVRAYLRAEEAISDPSLVRRLKSVLDDPPPVRRDVKQAVLEVEEVLNLPIWKHRHELYSVWVLTQIISALGGPQHFKFDLDGDEFHIPFSPTLLGSAEDLRPPVRVWGEVRYPLRSPGGKGRVGGMQPDYSLTMDARDPPKETFALVECKQYLRPSSKNFREALTDYAKGQPGAAVALVNYGPVGRSVIKSIPTRLQSRIKAIGHFQPLQRDCLQEFADWVRTQVDKHTVADLACIELNWGRWPSDLDLHLFVPTPDGKWQAVNFSSEGELDTWPWARLAADVTDGFGPEVIDIRQALPGIYRVAVKLYSDEVLLAGSGATLTLQVKGRTDLRFDCPAVGDGVWWHVCDVDFFASLVTEVNRIDDTAFPGDPV